MHRTDRRSRAHGPRRDRPVTVGVDYGTLSGRAVVVRVSDGAELGSAVCEYPHAVVDRSLPAELAAATRLGPDWALQVPADYVRGAAHRRPRRPRRRGRRPRPGHRHRHRLHRLHDGAHDRRRHPAVRAADRVAEPHAYVKLWKHHAAQPQADRINELARKRGEAWLPRYGGLISSEWEFAKGLQLLEEAPDDLRRDGALGRGRRLDRLAAVRRVRPQRLHRRLQGHLPGRHLPDPRRSSARSTRTSPTSSRTSSTPRSASSAPPPGG